MIKPHNESIGKIVPTVSPIKPESIEKKYQDWPFAILFTANVGVIFVLMVAFIVRNNNDMRDSFSDNNIKDIVGVASGMAVLAMALGVLMAKMIPLYAYGMIIFVLWFKVGVAVAFVALGIASANIYLIVFGAIMAGLNWCYVRGVKHRIPLAVAHLRVTQAAIAKNTVIYVVSLVFTILQIFWVVMWTLALLGVSDYISSKNDNTESAQGGNNYGWAYVLLLLSFYWSIQVFENIVHTTIAGTVAAFWYSTESPNTTTASLKRAMTTSFGSICFGSLIVAILHTLHALAKNSGRKKGCSIVCIAECILSWLEAIIEYLNRWAYVYVAVYGYSFIKAGKAVSQLFRQRGFTALINDDLVRIVIRLTATGIGLICAGFGAAIAELTDAFTFEYSTRFVIGSSVALTPLAIVNSSVATIFVCFAEDPVPLQRSHPELYAALAQGWHGLHPDFIVQAGYWHDALQPQV